MAIAVPEPLLLLFWLAGVAGAWVGPLCGVGVGLTAFYDFLGFFPSTAYLEIATRVDDPSKAGDVQVLFGSSQPF